VSTQTVPKAEERLMQAAVWRTMRKARPVTMVALSHACRTESWRPEHCRQAEAWMMAAMALGTCTSGSVLHHNFHPQNMGLLPLVLTTALPAAGLGTTPGEELSAEVLVPVVLVRSQTPAKRQPIMAPAKPMEQLLP
jgi:hypothetical protein